MSRRDDRLPSWRPGPTRDALLTFLEAVAEVPVERRVACLDNDGTLSCERPSSVQLDFFVWMLKNAVARGTLVEYDVVDPDRSRAESLDEAEPITDVAVRLGWTVVRMACDWETVFPSLA